MSSNPMDREIARLLAEGQAAARRGDRALARTLLSQLVEQEPHNEEAWMWLSGVVTDVNEQQICLENALVINPYNDHARRGLEFVVMKTGNPSRIPPVADMPAAPVYSQPAPTVPEPPKAEAPTFPTWAEPGPESTDPFLATAPYIPSSEPKYGDGHDKSHGNGNGNGNGKGNSNGYIPSSGDTVKNDVSATVPYTAPEPMPTDTSFASGPLRDAPAHVSGAGGMNSDGWNAGGVGGAEAASPQMEDFNLDDLELDAQPFVPPGMENAGPSNSPHRSGFESKQSKLGASEDTATDLPAWLEGLTPTVDPSSGSQDDGFSPFDISNFGSQSGTGMSGMSGMGAMNGMHDPNMPFGAPGGMDMNPAGPYSADMRLPSPHELPGDDGHGGTGQSQPWYLQSSGGGNTMAPPMPTGGISSYLDSTMLNGSMVNGGAVGGAVLDGQRGKMAATIECPNCKEHVPDTSLACPNCRYNFFVNCPHCHELVDTADGVPGQTAPCPYCKVPINKMELGMGGVPDLVSQKNPGSRPAAAGAPLDAAFPAMQQDEKLANAHPRSPFNWVVDLLWLIAVVLMVWALTQLPTWLHLSGMY